MKQILNRVARTLAIRSVFGTLKLVAMHTIDLLKCLMPSYRAALHRKRLAEQEFDRRYGVETNIIFRPGKSQVLGNNWIHGVKYEPISHTIFRKAMASFFIQHEEFVFIDFGSGKGRALLLAASFPFKRIIGIEYCEDLHRVSCQNLINNAKISKLNNNIDLVCQDAAEYRLPNEPLVLFFNNPFGRQVKERVVKNVVDSFRSNRRPMVVIYVHPHDPDLWDNVSFLRRIRPDDTIWSTHDQSWSHRQMRFSYQTPSK